MAKKKLSWLNLHETGYNEFGEENPDAPSLAEIAEAQYERAHGDTNNIRPCNCGSGASWVECRTASQYCG